MQTRLCLKNWKYSRTVIWTVRLLNRLINVTETFQWQEVNTHLRCNLPETRMRTLVISAIAAFIHNLHNKRKIMQLDEDVLSLLMFSHKPEEAVNRGRHRDNQNTIQTRDNSRCKTPTSGFIFSCKWYRHMTSLFDFLCGQISFIPLLGYNALFGTEKNKSMPSGA